VSVLTTLSDIERRDARGQNFQADLLNNARIVGSKTTKFGRITHVGRGVFPGISHAPTARVRCSSAAQFWGFSSVNTYIIIVTMYQLRFANCVLHE